MNAEFKGLKDDGRFQTATIFFTHPDDKNWNCYVSEEHARNYVDSGVYLSNPSTYSPEFEMPRFWEEAWKAAQENYERSHPIP